MKLGGFGNPNYGVLANRSVRGLDGFYRYNRFIILSKVTSDSIPNILDIVFNITAGSMDFIPSESEKTKVTVINNSEVYGSIHGMKDTRTRSVYIHHGMADVNIDRIRGDTPIRFVDVDYNVIADKPTEIEHGHSLKEVGEVKLSYDRNLYGNALYRDEDTYQPILVPSPEFYDEKDMILLSGVDEDYCDRIDRGKENIYYENKNKYLESLYSLTLNDLIDEHTKVMKLNIKIDNLTVSNNRVEGCHTAIDYNNMIHETVCKIKYSMERNGFSSGEIILNGNQGYNVTDLKTYLDLSNIEKRINFSMLCGDIEEINEILFGDYPHDYSYMIKVDYANIKVVIVDFVPSPIGGILKTDSDVNELGTCLKTGVDFEVTQYTPYMFK
jgi:hypothetical protein